MNYPQFNFKNMQLYETETKLRSVNKPLPALEIGVRANTKSRKEQISKKNNSRLRYKKRTVSRKRVDEQNRDTGSGFYAQAFTETKHLINNCSPNYIELNKIVMEKLSKPIMPTTDFESCISELNGLARTTRYKYGLKGILVSLFS